MLQYYILSRKKLNSHLTVLLMNSMTKNLYGSVFEYASNYLNNDKQFVLEAVK